jgi:hypothetical protein
MEATTFIGGVQYQGEAMPEWGVEEAGDAIEASMSVHGSNVQRR